MNLNESSRQGLRELYRRMTGFIANPVLLALTAALLIAAAAYAAARTEARTRQCIQQLRHIYLALEMYELDHGTLPHMALYPDDARYSPDSMLVALDPYAITSEIGICPQSHDLVRQRGLSYVWNANLNGKHLHEQDADIWLVADLSALSDIVRPPHFGRYLILYANGEVVRSRRPPAGLREVAP